MDFCLKLFRLFRYFTYICSWRTHIMFNIFRKNLRKKRGLPSGSMNSEARQMKNKFIKNTFLKLTSKTCPYGNEDQLVKKMIECGLFPSDIESDIYGNYIYRVGESRTIFTSHLDTACRDVTEVNHVITGNMIKTDGKSILGADDKAGVTIMLYMIKNQIPGVYYFFIGEETGCVGSGLASGVSVEFRGKYDRMISFDRRSTDSVITYQSSTRCCSDEFADNLASELNKNDGLHYKKDNGGIYTDSAEFADIISECTNLSVGYYNEHTHTESQDISHLEKLAEACLKIDWESLVTKRDPSKVEYKSYEWGDDYGYGEWGSHNGGRQVRRSGFVSNYDMRNQMLTPVESSSAYNNELKKKYGYYNAKEEADLARRESTNSIHRSHGMDCDYVGEGAEYSEDDYFKNVDKFQNSKKTKRGGRGRKKNKIWYDDGGNKLVDMGYSDSDIEDVDVIGDHNTNHYEWIKIKFLEDKLTKEEMEIVKDQYLDMYNPDDKRFYQILVSSLFGCDQFPLESEV